MLKRKKRYQVKAKNIKLRADEHIVLKSKNADVQLASQTHLIINVDVLECEAGAGFEIGTQQSFIALEKNIVKTHAKKLVVDNDDGMKYFGAINQNSAPANLTATKIKPLQETIRHQQKSDKQEHQIDNLSWSQSSANIKEHIKAQFNIAGYKAGDVGYIIICKCWATDQIKIDAGALKDFHDNETYMKIERIKFTVGDKNIYEIEEEHQTTPGDARINIDWSITPFEKADHNKISYYRFYIKILGEVDSKFSGAMQWFNNVNITHKGKAKVHAIKLERANLKALKIAPDETIYPLVDDRAYLTQVPLDSNNKLFYYQKPANH